MIIKIDANQLDTLRMCCVRHDLSFKVYTVESNRLIKQVEILQTNGCELSAEAAFIFGKIFQGDLEQAIAIEKLKNLL